MLAFSFKTENKFLIYTLDLWEKQGIFKNHVRKKLARLILMASLY